MEHFPPSAKSHAEVRDYVLQWVGYRKSTEEPAEQVMHDIPKMVKAYWKGDSDEEDSDDDDDEEEEEEKEDDDDDEEEVRMGFPHEEGHSGPEPEASPSPSPSPGPGPSPAGPGPGPDPGFSPGLDPGPRQVTLSSILAWPLLPLSYCVEMAAAACGRRQSAGGVPNS